MAHLKLDDRGYPIPFFAGYIDGKPNFRFQDVNKRAICIKEHKCPICGKKLPKDYSYVLTGPLGLKNRIVSDAPMHRVCAEFSLNVCPHIHFEKAQRIEEGPPERHILMDKPASLYLIKIDKYKIKRDPGNVYFNFRVVSYEEYVYVDGILEKK